MKMLRGKQVLLSAIAALSSLIYFAADTAGIIAERFAVSELESMGINGTAIYCESTAACAELFGLIEARGIGAQQVMFISSSYLDGQCEQECLLLSCGADNETIVEVSMTNGQAINRGQIARAELCCVTAFPYDNAEITVSANRRRLTLKVNGSAQLQSTLLESIVSSAADMAVLLVPQSVMEQNLGYSPTSIIAFPKNEQEQAALKSLAESVGGTVKVNSLTAQREGIETLITTISGIIKILAGFSVVTCILCVGVFVSLMVAGDRRKIGIKRALGASERRIVLEYMQTGVIITAFGTLFSALLCFVGSMVAQHALGLEIITGFRTLFVAGVIVLVSAVMSALSAAKAARRLPADCFRE